MPYSHTKSVVYVPPNLLPPLSPAPRPGATQIAAVTGVVPPATKQVQVILDPGLIQTVKDQAKTAPNPLADWIARHMGAGNVDAAAGGPNGGQVTSVEQSPIGGPGIPVTKAQVRAFYVHLYVHMAQGHGGMSA